MTAQGALAARCIIDAHLHIWSNGFAPYPWVAAPPAELQATATAESLLKAARSAGVTGALIVQPANHKFDHSYVSAALRAQPHFFRGCCLANPTLPVAEATRELEKLKAEGYVAVRFNPYLFPDGMDSPVGRALYAKAGELNMPVGVMAFGGLPAQLPAIEALLTHSPSTMLIIDHMGFFRQPATGGLLGTDAANDEIAWKGLLTLASRPQVYVKISALFRTSAELPPHRDLQGRVEELLAAFGARRLMWGSDFPFVTIGGNTPSSAATSYEQAVQIPSFWNIPSLDQATMDELMGGTAARLFGFSSATVPA
eukprot:CAMPEP_0119299326 /NCGR_PEP_ID=MMETSP1333-20130426/1403_1 /TAXON_ID=418940 /ORGANISM="Scyphosphaera apsteinii, Strain RCC1455" /LENGTH=311 /DNA_ID=CAMNT_0007300707 /DNA_START=116 /DNA_END=1051 /DNA_ORIENTATION=-